MMPTLMPPDPMITSESRPTAEDLSPFRITGGSAGCSCLHMDLSALPPLGPDAIHASLTPSRLNEILSARRGKLKQILMNQAIVSGLDNIYTCEILWSAHLTPNRNILCLEAVDYEALAESIADVLNRAIAAGGATLDDYRGTSGAMGYFDLSFSVYGRGGKTCARCRSQITVQTLMGRITYWCPGCQL
jgi:formamidopyrimidine-DNA glycosylase